MRRLLMFVMVFGVGLGARAQGVRYDNQLLSAQGLPVAGASVAVCTIAANTSLTPCSPLVTIYSDRGETAILANPTTASGLGNYGFFASPGSYLVQIYGPGLTTQVYTITLPCDPSSSSGCGTASGLSTTTAVSTGTLSVTGNISATGTLSGSNVPSATVPSVSGTPTTGDCVKWASGTSIADSGSVGCGAANAAVKPALTDAVQYVSANGNDTNDGLSWGTAVADIYQAWLNLYAKGGTFGAGNPGGGTIYVGSKATCGGPVANQGLWVMGPGDPNSLGFSGAKVTITGMSRTSNIVTVTLGATVPSYYAVNAAFTVIGASDSSFNGNFTVASVTGSQFTYSQTAANGSATAAWIVPKGWVEEMSVRVIGVGTQTYGGNQPGIPVASTNCGGASLTLSGLWFSGTNVPMHFENLSFGGYFPLNIGKTDSNNATSNTSGSTTLSFRNVNFGATAASGSGPAAWLSAGVFWIWFNRCMFTGSGNGAALSEQRQAVVMDGQGGAGGLGLVFFDEVQMNSGGLYFFASSTSSTNGVYINKLTTENQSDGSAAVTIFDPIGSTFSYASHINAADASGGGFAGYGVVVQPSAGGSFTKDLGLLSNQTVVENGGQVSGPMIILGENSGTLRPSTSGQSGFYKGHVYGETDVDRRQFAWSTQRFAATTDGTRTSLPGTWTMFGGPSNGTITTVTGPDGDLDAGDVSTTQAGQQSVVFQDVSSFTPATGDYIIAGVWARSVGANGYSGGAAIGTSGNVSCTGLVLTPLGAISYGALGDGAWEWLWRANKVKTGTGACEWRFGGNLDSTHETQFYGPVLLHIAAGTITDGEAAEIASNLASYSTYCPAGETCTFPGHAIGFDPTLSGKLGTLTTGALTAARTWTLPDATGTLAETSQLPLSGTLAGSTTALAANSCGDAVAVTITGATTSMGVNVTPQSWTATTGLVWDAWVSAANTVTIRYCNVTAASITPPATTFNIRVIQ